MITRRYDIRYYDEPALDLVESFDGRYVLYTDYAALEARCAGLEQVSADLCPDCGWAMKFPDEPCRNCEVHGLRKERDALQAKLAAAEEALRGIYNGLVEINPNNHDEDDVFTQNNSVIESIQIAAAALADTTTDEVQP